MPDEDGDSIDVSTALGRSRKQPRPEIQLYRPGMLRKGDSTKSIPNANDERPPRPERFESNNRRRSNDTDNITSRGESGSTTPDANVINDRYGRFAHDSRHRSGEQSSYNSTQSLYDTRKTGGYADYHSKARDHRGTGRGGGSRNYRPQFERPSHNRNGYNERSSMRGDGAITKRNVSGKGGRKRNDSINSTQSEMPQSGVNELHIDTSNDSVSQCGASTGALSMNSLGDAMSFEEMRESVMAMGSFDWSQEVENEFIRQQEEEERLKAEELAKSLQKVENEQNLPNGMLRVNRNRLQESNGHQNYHQRSPRRRNHRYRRDDHSDRESSFGGSIAEEDEDEELQSGERTPTSTREGYSYGNRGYAKNNENGYRKQNRQKPVVEKRYRGEHDDRDDERNEYDSGGITSHMSTGRLAGRIKIVKNYNKNDDGFSNARPIKPHMNAKSNEEARTSKYSEKLVKTEAKIDENEDMTSREAANRKRKDDIEKNEGIKIKEIGDKIAKLAPSVAKKKDLDAAKRMVELSLELASIYSGILFPDISYTFSSGLEQLLFKQAFYKAIDPLRSGANSSSSNSKLVRAVLQRLIMNGINFYEKLIESYEEQFDIKLSEAVVWNDGFPSDEELSGGLIDLPYGAQKYQLSKQKIAIKSLSRHLVSLGDLHRYKTLVDGSENYSISQRYYLKATQLWPSTGHPYNQLGVLAYYSMLYRSARRARFTSIDVLSRQRQSRVIDEIFFLARALACSYPYEAAKDRLAQRLSAMRAKVTKYEPELDKECGKVRDESKILKKMQRTREIWINPVTGDIRDDSGDRVVNDILSHFMKYSNSKVHRRAVSYIIDAIGMLITKIGMDHFGSVSERAFGLLFVSLVKPETDFSVRQLVQLASLFIYAVQNSKNNLATGSFSIYQLKHAANALMTFYLVLLQILNTQKDNLKNGEYSKKVLLVLPAINLISTWIIHEDGGEIIRKVENLSSVPSTILKMSCTEIFAATLDSIGDSMENVSRGVSAVHPEILFMSSFFKAFDTNLASCRSRMCNLVESIRIVQPFCGEEERNEEEKVSEDDEKVFSREELVEMERRKNRFELMVKPENLVIDTNVFIDHLDIVERIAENKHFQIVVPTMVVTELSGLSLPSTSNAPESERDKYTREKARAAFSWLKEQARCKNPRLATLTTQGKKIGFLVASEDNSHSNKINDDMILQSCINLMGMLPSKPASDISISENCTFRSCVLLTEDRGLSIKAISQQLPCRNVQKFAEWAGII